MRTHSTQSASMAFSIDSRWIYSYSTTAVLLVATLFALHIESGNANTVITQCDEVKQAYVGMGFSSLDVPDSSIITKDAELEICPAGFSCCTRDMEIQLTSHSATTYDERLLNATASAKKKLTEATTRLHTFFTRQIDKTEKETDNLFFKAYKDRYTQNKEVFEQLFTNFRKYYSGEELDIGDAIHQFFRDVFVRMLNLQYPLYNFTESYLTCVGDKMDSIAPFSHHPQTLYRGLRQALAASRTFIQGLAVGRNVAIKTQNIQPTVSCSKAHMKMDFCSHCRGLPSLKPCANYCLNVMKGCLAYHSQLDRYWQRYVDAMDALALRVSGDGSFNLESVLKPLKDQLSIAVMEYHMNSKVILDKVLDSSTGCGLPLNFPSERAKRESPMFEGTLPLRLRTTESLKTYIDGVKTTLRDVKYLWSHTTLAGTMCSAISATTGERCWNGANEAQYNEPLVKDGLIDNRDNPEVEVDVTRSDPVIVEQINQLRGMTERIINATIGAADVTWINLQMPLPNVTGLTSEGAAVNSGGGFRIHRLQALLSDGSGSGSMRPYEDDDEDNGSGHFQFDRYGLSNRFTGQEGSASGDGSIAKDDEDDVIVRLNQPNVGGEETATQQIFKERTRAITTLKYQATPTTTPHSSSNVVLSTISTLVLALVLAYL